MSLIPTKEEFLDFMLNRSKYINKGDIQQIGTARDYYRRLCDGDFIPILKKYCGTDEILKATDISNLKKILEDSSFVKINQNKSKKGVYSAALNAYIQYLEWLKGGKKTKAAKTTVGPGLFPSRLAEEPTHSTEPPTTTPSTSALLPFSLRSLLDEFRKDLADAEYIYEKELVDRYVLSLLTKPFVILSGLAGSGKTQLAINFARWMAEKDKKEQVAVIAVGADWTNREPLLGFKNALIPDKYEHPESGVLNLLIEAKDNPKVPYFLILDEMNLSYVERYFADFLSAMESGDEIPLWNPDKGIADKTPDRIILPKNVFITGTINVDETTYMFSPKVLDRANVIEFKVTASEMEGYLKNKPRPDRSKLLGKGNSFCEEFTKKAIGGAVPLSISALEPLNKFFVELQKVQAEFGYRTASEIIRFLALCHEVGITDENALDAAIVQKLLPKLHGSRRKVQKVLQALWNLCLKFEKDEASVE